MARPNTTGLDYFPVDIDADLDDKLGMIIGEFGIKGETLYFKLLGWLYKHDGYFMEWEESVQLKFLRRYDYCGFSLSFVNEVVPRFIKWGLFDKAVFDAFQILTSERTQKTWVEGTRKRSGRRYHSEIWLIDVPDGLKAEETPIKTEETPQSKVKESKVKETKVKSPNGLVVAGDNARAIEQQKKQKYEKLVQEMTGREVAAVWTALKDFVAIERPAFFEPYRDTWNIFADTYGLSKIEAISDSRRAKLKTRLTETVFNFIGVLEKIRLSKHLRGDNSQRWKVSLDWILDNEKNYLKILEGNYDA